MSKKRLKERCSVSSGCNRKAQVKHECLTCLKLKAGTVFVVCGCRWHKAEALTIIKRHALTAHPVNMLRAGVAALKGEDIE
jgi:hypothetical protein